MPIAAPHRVILPATVAALLTGVTVGCAPGASAPLRGAPSAPATRASVEAPGGAATHPPGQAAAALSLTWLGTAGWEISDGSSTVLVDPYISRLSDRVVDRPADPVLLSDTAAVAQRIRAADLILVTHSHFDHLLDVPYAARKTGALVIGTPTTAAISRAQGVPDSQLVQVRGGEDYQFGAVSVRVVPSLHSVGPGKQLIHPGALVGEAAAPVHYSEYVEGGTLAFLLRMAGLRVLVLGSANYVEREVRDLDPDVVLLPLGGEGDVFDYTGRLLRATGRPGVVLATHWDDPTLPYGDTAAVGSSAEQHELLAQLTAQVHAAAPDAVVRLPRYFEPVVVTRRGGRAQVLSH